MVFRKIVFLWFSMILSWHPLGGECFAPLPSYQEGCPKFCSGGYLCLSKFAACNSNTIAGISRGTDIFSKGEGLFSICKVLASSSGPPRGNIGWRFTAGLKSMDQTKLDINSHSFWRSFRWYQRRCWPRTGTLETLPWSASNIEHREKLMFPELIQDDVCDIPVSYNVHIMHSWSL